MPQLINRKNLSSLEKSQKSYWLLFLLSLFFIISGLFVYAYLSKKLDTQTAISYISQLHPTPTIYPTQVPVVIPQITDTDDSTPVATPTPETPYLKTYTNQDLNFTFSYMSTRSLFEDERATEYRFVLVNPEGNFVVHVGKTDWSWTHSGRQFSDKFQINGKPTFVYDTTSQKIIDIKTDTDLFYTIQCVHNGNEELLKDCDDLIKSFAFLN